MGEDAAPPAPKKKKASKPKAKKAKRPAKKAAKRKASKPKAKAAEPRNERLDFRLTKSERAKLYARAASQRRTVSSVVLERIEPLIK